MPVSLSGSAQLYTLRKGFHPKRVELGCCLMYWLRLLGSNFLELVISMSFLARRYSPSGMTRVVLQDTASIRTARMAGSSL